MKNIAAIVLAAGRGTRMKSPLPKVLHPLLGRPMLHYPLRVLHTLGITRIITVIGHKAPLIEKSFDAAGIRELSFCLQKEQLGTGHAVMVATKKLKTFKGDILILSGDVPLIQSGTIKKFVNKHKSKPRVKDRPAISLLTIELDDPKGYGRVIRDAKGTVREIIEDCDLTPKLRSTKEINTGIYLLSADFLFKNLKKLSTNNAQGEYYLPDLVGLANKKGLKVDALKLKSAQAEEVMGINNRVELARAASHMRRELLDKLMLSGVTITDPATTYIDDGVKIGRDTLIHPNTYILGHTTIGAGSVIEEGVKITDSTLAAKVHIKSSSIIESSVVGTGSVVGPFARLRPDTVLDSDVKVGNYVEIKKSKIGRGSKASHLSYIGDSKIGKNVNIGAGVITCNYDGKKKHKTIIEDGAFIGSDSQLVAPVKIGRGAYIGSGSTISKNVAAGALSLTRPEQKTIKNWQKKKGK